MRYLMWIPLAAILTMAILGGSSAQADEQQDIGKSVVLILCVKQDFDYVTPWKQTAMTQGIGSGFIIAGKKILTNAHNVSNYRYIEVKKENIAKRYPAKVAFIGHDCDLAILTVEDETFFNGTVPLEPAGIPAVNTKVSTYGFPLGGNHISVTQGIVSRIETDIYAHSGADSHLVIQTDAAINPGNSGGPVMQTGKVVGVAFQGVRQAENIGYLIPTTVIRHFLADIEDGKYNGFGSLGVSLYSGLHSVSYKEYLKVPPPQNGVVVIATMMHSSVESILQSGDVITQIDDYSVDDDGMVQIYGMTLNLSEVIEAKQIGEAVRLTFYRNGEKMQKTATVALNRPILEYARQYDQIPRYFCFAGLVFVPVTRNYLETGGHNWLVAMSPNLRYLFANSMQLNTDRHRKEYVVLAEIMPDEINSYAADFKGQVLESVDGTLIHSLGDVHNALKQSAENFYIIKFMSNNRILPIDAQKARSRQQSILSKYNIPAEAQTQEHL